MVRVRTTATVVALGYKPSKLETQVNLENFEFIPRVGESMSLILYDKEDKPHDDFWKVEELVHYPDTGKIVFYVVRM